MIDLLIVLGFIVYAVSNGLRSRERASEDLEQYFLAGRTIPGWKAGTSMAATQFAADTPLLVTGLIATGGVFLLWRLWIYGIAFLVMAFVFSALWRRSGVLTDAELTEIRYSGRGVLFLRVLKAVYYGTIINCVVMAMVLVAAVRIAEVFLPWHAWLPAAVFAPLVGLVDASGLEIASGATGIGPLVATTNNLISILAIVLFTALYSMTGGLRSVVATDAVQFGLAIVGTLVYAWIVLGEVGGLGALSDRVVDLYGMADARTMLSFAPGPGDALLPFLVVIGLQWLFQMNSDGTGYLAQRSMGCATDRDARVAGVVFAWLQIFLRSLLWLVIAVGLLVIYPFDAGAAGADGFAASRELLFVTGIDELLPVGIRGIMLTGMLAALASTVDTHLNWGASYWSNDVYRRLVCETWLDREPGDRELVVAARLANLLILAVALAIMANLGSIQDAWFLSLLFGAGMGSVLVLRWLWERISLYSELAAIATSLVVAPLLLFSGGIAGWLGLGPELTAQLEAATGREWVRLAVMAAASTAAAVGVTWFTPGTDEATLERFYRRVRPMGHWPTGARLAGEDPARGRAELWRELRTAGLTALSLFLLLVGVGGLVVSTPGTAAVWFWTWIALGLALVPFWWGEAVGRGPVRERMPEAEPAHAVPPAGSDGATPAADVEGAG